MASDNSNKTPSGGPTVGGANKPTGFFRAFREDFLASIVVFLVALPLCIGIAVAVGVSPTRALITGIIGGLIVGFFSGSPLQVSGPAAGLFVIVADLISSGKESFIARAGSGEVVESEAVAYSLMVLGTAVFLSGILQVIAGRLKLGQWFRAVSPAVIKGMLAGIGFLILVSQFHVMLDHVALWHGEKAHGGLQYLATIPEAIMKCFSTDTTHNHHLAALTGIVTIACLILWPMIPSKKLKIVPAALVAIVVATVFANVNGLEIKKIEIAGNLLSDTTFPVTATWFQLLLDPLVIKGAIVIALIASAETLLCATAVDQMHTGERTNYDKELSAQGIGNILCGLVGALPMTGVIVRSSANVNSGGKTRLSTILHGAWLLLFVALLPQVLGFIPRAALGALLVHIGIKLLNLKQIPELWKTSKSEVGIFLATVLVIVGEDLLVGVIVGIMLSAIKLLHRFSHLELQLNENEDVSTLEMQGAATFLRLPQLAATLEKVPDSSELRVDFRHLSYIDHACLDLLMNWEKQHEGQGGKLMIDWSSLHGRFSEAPDENLKRVKLASAGSLDVAPNFPTAESLADTAAKHKSDPRTAATNSNGEVANPQRSL
ncbi:SulP family inorganic anion transporter [Mariniblastus fucicola]|uniref:Bicarbonate transporter BicA n=1 Tax=Mariniblastus fucicola TaxID=980251 RepID=A0A5B9PDE3_9BACT|nr:SulP family inorganic anion transporter [Mariniblastus fucicola]QEG23479.1 Bicarbonate transporter BicA [Mariniblastus fucicola]